METQKFSREQAEKYYASDPASHLHKVHVKNYDIMDEHDLASMRKSNRKTKLFLESLGRTYDNFPQRYFVDSDDE